MAGHAELARQQMMGQEMKMDWIVELFRVDTVVRLAFAAVMV